MSWTYGEWRGTKLRVSETGEVQAMNKRGNWVSLVVKVGNNYGQWRNEYPFVYVPYKEGKHGGNRIRVCSLVAYICYGPSPYGYVVAHKDGNVLNCAPSNITYTKSYSRHVYGGKGLGYKAPRVQKISPDWEVLDEYENVVEAAVDSNVSESFILDRCNNRLARNPFRAAGFSFRFKEG